MAAICGNQRLFRQKKVYVPHTPCTAGERGARCRPGAGGREEWRRGRPPLRVFSEGCRYGGKPGQERRARRLGKAQEPCGRGRHAEHGGTSARQTYRQAQQRNGSEHRLPDAPGAEAPLTHTTKPASSQRRRGFFCSLRGGADREHPCGFSRAGLRLKTSHNHGRP